MLTIAGLAFREVLHKRVLVFALLMTAAFLALYGLALHYMVRDLGRLSNPLMAQVAVTQLFSVGLYLGSFICSFLAVFSAVGTLSGEIENGTMYAIVAKPIHRRDIVLGKYMGYAAMMACYAAVFFLSLLGLVYWKTNLVVSGIVPALLLFCLQPLVLLSITMLGTSVFSTLGNGIAVLMLWAVSTIGGMIEQVGTMIPSQSLINAGIISSLILPADAIYRRLSYTMLAATDNPVNALGMLGPFGTQSPPSNAMLIYTIAYMAIALLLAVRAFDRRDI